MYTLPKALAELVRRANASGVFADDIPRAAVESRAKLSQSCLDSDLQQARRLKDGFAAISDEGTLAE